MSLFTRSPLGPVASGDRHAAVVVRAPSGAERNGWRGGLAVRTAPTRLPPDAGSGVPGTGGRQREHPAGRGASVRDSGEKPGRWTRVVGRRTERAYAPGRRPWRRTRCPGTAYPPPGGGEIERYQRTALKAAPRRVRWHCRLWGHARRWPSACPPSRARRDGQSGVRTRSDAYSHGAARCDGPFGVTTHGPHRRRGPRPDRLPRGGSPCPI